MLKSGYPVSAGAPEPRLSTAGAGLHTAITRSSPQEPRVHKVYFTLDVSFGPGAERSGAQELSAARSHRTAPPCLRGLRSGDVTERLPVSAGIMGHVV